MLLFDKYFPFNFKHAAGAEPWERRELAPLPPPDEPPPESVEANSPPAEPSASSVEPSALPAQPVPTPDLPAGIKEFKTTCLGIGHG